jgi:hypothetical protein
MNCKQKKLLLRIFITITVKYKKKLLMIKERSDDNICKPLIDDLIFHLEKRFYEFFEISGKGEFAAIAALLHPKFIVYWITCLSADNQEKVKQLTQNLLRSERNQESPPAQNQETDDFFDFDDSTLNPLVATTFVPQTEEENQLMRYINEGSKTLDVLNRFPKIKQLFIKFN